jgi:ATP-dependent DNA helicase RecQ
MNQRLIKEHVSYIENISNTGDKRTVCVYKGFSTNFLRKINEFFPHVDALSCLNSENKIDLLSIKNNFWNLGSKLTSTKNKISFMLYEEFLLLPPHSLKDFPISFIIVNNNFYSNYPNQTEFVIQDIEESINNDIDIKEDDTFNRFYSDSKIIAEFNCIQYLDYELNLRIIGIDSLDFYDSIPTTPIQYKDILKIQPSESNIIIPVQFGDFNYNKFKYNLFFDIIPNAIEFLIDESLLKNPKYQAEINILGKILAANDFEISFYKKINDLTDSWREELDLLLQKHWNENAKFKKIKIYTDPDISNETVEISQGSIVEHIIKQSELAQLKLPFEDVFLTAPTGAGKSLLFQLPAIYLSEKNKSVTIVVSPLKALMLDQVTALKNERKFGNVAFLNSDLSLIERQNIIQSVINGLISVLYMSPELLLSYDIKTFLGERELGLLIIDEAHLVTTWGRDFRVDYWFLGNYIRKLRLGSSIKGQAKNQRKVYQFPVVALTATAVYNGEDDMVFETISSLNMIQTRIYIGQIKRKEIGFKYNQFQSHSHELEKFSKTADRVKEFINENKKSIFYFPWIKQIENININLDENIKKFISKYHAELNSEERRQTLSQFKNGEIKTVLATKAFGMGIDISDIEIVYHHAPSGTLADYVQEIGRLARLPDLKGSAVMDFNPKDLKFTRILFGLSSLKQFQVNLVLRKLNSLFQIKKNRNMLVSIEDFQYIFTKDINPEQKVKSALLVIEKDLYARYDYNVIIVRPKSLFSTVFASVNENDLIQLKSQFGTFIEEINLTNSFPIDISLPDGTSFNRSYNKKNIKINLDKIWERFYSQISFPELKYKFFNKELFTNIDPLLKIQIHLNNSINTTKIQFENNFANIETALFSLRGSYFTKERLASKLNETFNNENLCKRLADLLTVFYADNNQYGRTGSMLGSGNFLQVERNGNDFQYKLINTAFTRVKARMIRAFHLTFANVDANSTEYSGFISAMKDKNREQIKLAYLLEILDLSTYEITGGELPQIFIRINDPQKLNSLSKGNYTNKVVEIIERSHEKSIKIMNYFFQNSMTDSERWDYIEDYFLGREVPLTNTIERDI